MELDRVLRDLESARNLLVGQAAGDSVQYLDFAWREQKGDCARSRDLAAHGQVPSRIADAQARSLESRRSRFKEHAAQIARTLSALSLSIFSTRQAARPRIARAYRRVR